MKKYQCQLCGYIYDEAAGDPGSGIAAGTKWEDIPAGWVCPICGAPKDAFDMLEDKRANRAAVAEKVEQQEISGKTEVVQEEDLRQLSSAELSVLCSSLAKGCEKQYLTEEMELFKQLADYYLAKRKLKASADLEAINTAVGTDLSKHYPFAVETSKSMQDRGALRVLAWSEKVSNILLSLLERYKKQGDRLLENTQIFVCDICGFVFVGDSAPDICPICKVPKLKIHPVTRG